MVWRAGLFGSAAIRERIARVATPLLLIRILEGVAGWVFFNEFFLSRGPAGWAIQIAFLAHLLLNPLVVLRYRRGRIPWRLIYADIASTLCPLALPVAASGGVSSPLLLLFAVKTAHYAIVFGSRVSLQVGVISTVVATLFAKASPPCCSMPTKRKLSSTLKAMAPTPTSTGVQVSCSA